MRHRRMETSGDERTLYPRQTSLAVIRNRDKQHLRCIGVGGASRVTGVIRRGGGLTVSEVCGIARAGGRGISPARASDGPLGDLDRFPAHASYCWTRQRSHVGFRNRNRSKT